MNSSNRNSTMRIWRLNSLSAIISGLVLVGAATPALAATDNEYATPPETRAQQEGDKGLLVASPESEMPQGLYKATRLIGQEVKDLRGESIGEIKDLALDTTQQRVSYAVLSFGGVLGVGDELFAVPMGAFEPSQQDNELVLNVTEQQLKEMKGFDDDHWPSDASGYWGDPQAASMNGSARLAAAGPVIKASEYLDGEVNNFKGEELGEIEDLAIELKTGKIKYAVIEHGGLLGIGEKLVAVPVSSLSAGPDEDEVVLNASQEELDRAVGFSDDNWPVAANSISDISFGSQQTDMAATNLDAEDFSDLDADHNGYLSRSEVNRMPELEQRYDSLDRDNDGRLDQAEFAQFEPVEQQQQEKTDTHHEGRD